MGERSRNEVARRAGVDPGYVDRSPQREDRHIRLVRGGGQWGTSPSGRETMRTTPVCKVDVRGRCAGAVTTAG